MLHCLDRQKCESIYRLRIYTSDWKQLSCDVTEDAVANKHQNQCKISKVFGRLTAKTMHPSPIFFHPGTPDPASARSLPGLLFHMGQKNSDWFD